MLSDLPRSDIMQWSGRSGAYKKKYLTKLSYKDNRYRKKGKGVNMAIFIQKISNSYGQYRVTLPRNLLKQAGLDKARVVEMWVTENSIVHIKEYHAKKIKDRRVPGNRPKPD
jgi:antitoxin component of MazEF toxin-antitoxin module